MPGKKIVQLRENNLAGMSCTSLIAIQTPFFKKIA